MGLETPTYISDLNSAWPLGADGKNTADDHLRNFKAAVKATFPNITGPVTSVQAQLNSPINGTAVASTSGTSIDFTSIPSWVKRITVNFAGVSLNATASVMVQIGDSGGIEATSYSGGLAGTAYTTGFAVGSSGLGASSSLNGIMQLVLVDAATNTWVATGVITDSATPNMVTSAGSKATSATLDRVRITTVAGTATFDAGLVNIQYD